MTIDTGREAIDRMTGLWGGGVEPNMARVTEVLTALARERDEALADIARIQKERAEFLAGVEALAGVLKGERDEALAREAALHALILEGDDPAKMGDADYLRRLAIAAAARDAALVEQGRREGIEEAARVVEGTEPLKRQPMLNDVLAAAIRALATPPAKGDPR
jgi:hypothetical protein